MAREFKTLNPKLLDSFDAAIFEDDDVNVTVREEETKIIIDYIFPGFYLVDDEREVEGKKKSFKQISMNNVGFLASHGKPLMPSFGRYIQIPHTVDFEVSVEKTADPVEYENIEVLPAQEKIIDKKDVSSARQKFEMDHITYSADEIYPERMVEYSGPFDIDGYNSVLLHVRPLEYNPKEKKIIGYNNITVTISFTEKDEGAQYPFSAPEVGRAAYGNFFVNPKRMIEERFALKYSTSESVSIPPRGPELLIIYNRLFHEAVDRLANWKEMRGIRTKIILIGEIGNSVDKLKKYIRNKRGNLFSRLRYVILFGDVETIVSETILDSPYGENITDYYYSTSKNPASSSELIFPWLSIGRIPVTTLVEANSIVDQIIRYEKRPPWDPEYYKRMVLAAYFQDDYPQDGKADRAFIKTMEAIHKHLSTLEFNVKRIYVSNNQNLLHYIDGQDVKTEVKKSIVADDVATNMLISTTSEGQLIIAHRDHGGLNGWENPWFEVGHLDSISSKYTSLFYSINCLTGMFDLPGSRDSFAEKLLKKDGAAPSVIAATRVSSTWLNNYLMKGLFDAMWAGVLPTFPGTTASYSLRYNRVGDVLNYAKTYLPIKISGSNKDVKDHFEIYHVVGDPTLEILQALPLILRINAQVNFSHLLLKLSSCPKGGVVTIWLHGQYDKLLKRIEPASKFIRLPLRSLLESVKELPGNEISVCFWAPGYRFQSIKVNI